MTDVESQESYFQRFQDYFARPVAEEAASSLADGVEIQLTLRDEAHEDETFVFTRRDSKNQVVKGEAKRSQLDFVLTYAAAERVLAEASEDIAEIGIGMMKLILSSDPQEKIQVRFRAGFMELFSHGYFGVLKTGGKGFASYMASQGLGGTGAIKSALKKMKRK